MVDYRAGAPTAEKKPLPFQAAQFSMLAPLVALVLGFVLTSAMKGDDGATKAAENSVKLILGWINIILIVSGLIAGIYALVSIKKYGAAGLLGRGITGVLLSGLLLSAVIYLIMGGPISGYQKKFIGQWKMDVPGGDVRLTFNPDKTAALKITNASGEITRTGKWRIGTFSDSPKLGLEFAFDPGQEIGGNRALKWIISRADADSLSLKTKDLSGADIEEIYNRISP